MNRIPIHVRCTEKTKNFTNYGGINPAIVSQGMGLRNWSDLKAEAFLIIKSLHIIFVNKNFVVVIWIDLRCVCGKYQKYDYKCRLWQKKNYGVKKKTKNLDQSFCIIAAGGRLMVMGIETELMVKKYV